MPAFSLFPKGGRDKIVCQYGRWAPKEGGFGGGPTSIGERNECQRGRYARRGVDCDVPHWLGRKAKHHLCFKNLKGKPEKKKTKRIISDRGELKSSQIAFVVNYPSKVNKKIDILCSAQNFNPDHILKNIWIAT